MFRSGPSKFSSEDNIPLLYQDGDANEIRSHRVVLSSSHIDEPKWLISIEKDIDTLVVENDAYNGEEINKLQAIISLIKCSVGTGVLALPSAIRYSGYLIGLPSILVFSVINVYCMHLLIEVVEHIRSLHPDPILNLDYEKTVELCFQFATVKLRKFIWIRYVLLFFLITAQIGFLSSYHIFVAENTKTFIDYYLVDQKSNLPIWGYQMIYFLLLTPLLFVKTLDKLSHVCQLANVLMVLSLIISLVYCYIDPLPIKQLQTVKISESTLLCFGIIIFSTESINLLNSVENHLKNKESMRSRFGIINLAFSFIIPVYLLVGFSGYWRFGENIASSIILSIPMHPWYFMLCKPFYIVSIIISYALQGFILYNVLWKKIGFRLRNTKVKIIGEVVLRISISLMTTILSISIPHFDLFISLIGAFSGAAILMIIPSICNAVMVYSTQTGNYWKVKIFSNAFILIIGIVGCFMGTYSSIITINHAIRN